MSECVERKYCEEKKEKGVEWVKWIVGEKNGEWEDNIHVQIVNKVNWFKKFIIYKIIYLILFCLLLKIVKLFIFKFLMQVYYIFYKRDREPLQKKMRN